MARDTLPEELREHATAKILDQVYTPPPIFGRKKNPISPETFIQGQRKYLEVLCYALINFGNPGAGKLTKGSFYLEKVIFMATNEEILEAIGGENGIEMPSFDDEEPVERAEKRKHEPDEDEPKAEAKRSCSDSEPAAEVYSDTDIVVVPLEE